ncbi:hypothetical protein [Carnobacterium sp. FSL E2-0243]|uniref:hypothetical protein n=1 Tax=Carnobacterium sp. FSL E2-0243 TaxID=2921365 RepID=UPI0030F4FDDA
MTEIKLRDKEIIAQLSYEDGWKPAVGVKVTIKGIDFSFVFKNLNSPVLVISELSSGAKLYEYKLTLLELLETTTKEQTYAFIRKFAKKVEMLIDSYGLEKIKKKVKDSKEKSEIKFGKMPEIRDCEGVIQ